jgi:hypothetical protein
MCGHSWTTNTVLGGADFGDVNSTSDDIHADLGNFIASEDVEASFDDVDKDRSGLLEMETADGEEDKCDGCLQYSDLNCV